ASLYLVRHGRVSMPLPGASAGSTALEFGAGQVLGAIQAVTGQPAHADAVACGACTVLALDRALQHAVASRFAAFDSRVALLATQHLRTLVFRRTLAGLFEGVDAALLDELLRCATEVTLPRGACLMRQGDTVDAWYVLTSGRLGVVTAAATGETRREADLMPGASVGEIGLIAGGVRSATIVADRGASLMRLAQADFERFADLHPAFARRLMSTVVQRLMGQLAPRRAAGARILVVLRASDSPALQATVDALGAALQRGGAAQRTRDGFVRAVGRRLDGAAAEATHPLWNQFDAWLEESQSAHALVLLDAGVADDSWQRECLLRADHCLWLVEPAAPEARTPPDEPRIRLRRALDWARQGGRELPCTLLLLHPAESATPRNTRAWLDEGCFDRHLHLRLRDAATTDRAARLLAGRGLGVALSGGGARGLAHIGVLRAFTELGIPIDCIGGTSIGAIQAAMYAMGLSAAAMVSLNRSVVAQRPFTEYTLPMIALVASRRRDAGIRMCFGDVRIEDLWLPYLAVSTDLNTALPVVHEHGLLGLAASASSSIPGVLVPVLDGPRVLVDGGIVNNLPADLVKARCGGTVFASRVAPSDAIDAPPDGFPSAWSLLWDELLPWRGRRAVPRIGGLLMRTMTMGSAEHMRSVEAQVDVTIEPDVARYGMLKFRAIDALVEAGHAAALPRLQAWMQANKAV
ncbi:MAG: patatin-like phospholipase family protein, partial [Caldimonas sp.]